MMNFAHPHFAEPRWLIFAMVAPVLLFALQRYAARARRRQLQLIAAENFIGELTRSHSPLRRTLKEILVLAAVAGLGIALARPQWGEQKLQEEQLAGEDVMFVLDCSRSMWSTDVSPNRMERARVALMDFVRRRGGGRVGLVAFSGEAFLQCPLTFDYDAFAEALGAVDDKTIAVPGTDIGKALEESVKTMDKDSRRRIIVLLTDGEDLELGGVDQAKKLAAQGVVIYAVGVGTPAGSQIQVTDEHGQKSFLRDSSGQIVVSHLGEKTLREIAQATHGAYYPLGALGEGLGKIHTAMTELALRSEAERASKSGVDRFHFPIAIALAGLVGESLISTRRRRVDL